MNNQINDIVFCCQIRQLGDLEKYNNGLYLDLALAPFHTFYGDVIFSINGIDMSLLDISVFRFLLDFYYILYELTILEHGVELTLPVVGLPEEYKMKLIENTLHIENASEVKSSCNFFVLFRKVRAEMKLLFHALYQEHPEFKKLKIVDRAFLGQFC